LQNPNSHGPKGLKYEIFEEIIRFDRDIRIKNVSVLTQSVPKSFPLKENQRHNPFWIGSACIELHSANAEKLLNEELEIGCNFPLC
jgi:hypothetical protein